MSYFRYIHNVNHQFCVFASHTKNSFDSMGMFVMGNRITTGIHFLTFDCIQQMINQCKVKKTIQLLNANPPNMI